MKKHEVLVAVLGLGVLVQEARTQSLHYTLLAESQFYDDCLICGRPTIAVPMRGRFTLRPEEVNPLFTTYRIEDVAWVGAIGTNVQYDIRGSGTYTVGGEVAVRKTMVLNLTVNGKDLVFTNDGLPSLRGVPDYVIDTSLSQTQENLLTFYSLDLLATPLREVWFSIGHAAPGAEPPAGPGDLLSTGGRVVKTNGELVQRLGFMPVVPHLGVDAIEIAPGGRILFSLNERQFSETLGEINDGDILSPEGSIYRKYYQLIGPFFDPVPAPPPDPGLDALHISDSEEILFSVRSNFFSPRLARTVGHGDLLTDRGQIFRSNAELLQRFQRPPAKDYGLDAVYIWPSGEIWFSTAEGFVGSERAIQEGDILSNAGYVAFRNHDLLQQFRTDRDDPDFGTDGLFVVTDLSVAAPPRITSITRGKRLQWQGVGRVFQVEKAARLTGPYLPATPIIPETEWTDALPWNAAAGFYRLRQW